VPFRGKYAKNLELIEKMPWKEPWLWQGLHSKHTAQDADLLGLHFGK
jgi:hypothetical protein